jgi:hypothetical protein
MTNAVMARQARFCRSHKNFGLQRARPGVSDTRRTIPDSRGDCAVASTMSPWCSHQYAAKIPRQHTPRTIIILIGKTTFSRLRDQGGVRMSRRHLEMLVLRHSAVGFMLMRNSRSPSDRRRRPGVFIRPIWRNNGSSQVTAATDQVSIDTHRWRASGGVLSTVFCDGF